MNDLTTKLETLMTPMPFPVVNDHRDETTMTLDTLMIPIHPQIGAPTIRDLRALEAAANADGKGALVALAWLVEEAKDAYDLREARAFAAAEYEDLEESLALAQDRMGDLEQLIAGYRERCTRLVRRLRARQRDDPHPPLPLLQDRQLAEDTDIERAHLLDAWALNIITGGECCAEAGPPPDWAGLGRRATLVHPIDAPTGVAS